MKEVLTMARGLALVLLVLCPMMGYAQGPKSGIYPIGGPGTPGPAGPPMDINALTEEMTPSRTADFLVIHSAASASQKKTRPNSFGYVIGPGGVPAGTGIPVWSSGGDFLSTSAFRINSNAITKAASVTNSLMTLSGGSTNATDGAFIQLFGSTHAKARIVEIVTGHTSSSWTDFLGFDGTTYFSRLRVYGDGAVAGMTSTWHSATINAQGAGAPLIAKTHASTVPGDGFMGMQTSGGSWIARFLGSGLLNIPAMGTTLGVSYWDTDGTLQKVTGTATDCVKVNGTSGACGSGTFTIASQEEAQEGTDNTKGMTPLRTAEAIAAQATAMIGRTVEVSVAKCQDTAAASGFNLPSSAAPDASCDTDGKPILTFAASDTTAADSFIMPASVSTIDATLMMRASASASTLSGNAVWRISYVCTVIDGTVSSVPTLSNTVDDTVTITATAANFAYPATFSIPATGCAGKRFHWALSLVSRTLAADPQVIDTFHVRVQ